MELRSQITFSHSACCDILRELVMTNFRLLGCNSIQTGTRYEYFGKDCCLIFTVVQEEYTARSEFRGLPSRGRE